MQIKTKYNFGDKILFPYWGHIEQGVIDGVKIKVFAHEQKPEIEYHCDNSFCYGQWRDEEDIELDKNSKTKENKNEC